MFTIRCLIIQNFVDIVWIRYLMLLFFLMANFLITYFFSFFTVFLKIGYITYICILHNLKRIYAKGFELSILQF